MMPMTRRWRAGFSAFEMGLCFLAIGIGSFVIVLWGRFAISRSHDVACGSNLHQLALAVQMYCNDNGGRGPIGPVAPGLNVYTKNQQIFVCPSNGDAPEQMVAFVASEPKGPEDLRPNPYPVPINMGYQFRPDVWNDESPRTLIVQDIAPDVHTHRTWQAARLDGAVVRFPASEWQPMGARKPSPKPEAESRKPER